MRSNCSSFVNCFHLYFLFVAVNSAYSIGGTKYDPELLRNDVHLAKDRVSRLKKELQRIQDEMHNKERGVQTLARSVVIKCTRCSC